MADRLRQSHAEIMAANEAMQQQNQVLETLSITDSLTGLYNRSKLDAILTDELARFKRTQRQFALLMLDIDHFKTLNDTYGHITGDEILVAVARILLQSIRSIDYAARYGGDEFIIILVETSADLAHKTAERIRSQVENMHYSANGSTIAVTVSIGIVQCQPDDMTPTAVFARADQALYEAKEPVATGPIALIRKTAIKSSESYVGTARRQMNRQVRQSPQLTARELIQTLAGVDRCVWGQPTGLPPVY